MTHQMCWSSHALITLFAVCLLAAWPFRRKSDAEEADADAVVEDEEATSPTIDNIDWGIRLGTLARYDRAADRFRQAVEEDPHDVVAKYDLALALDMAGQRDEAAGLYRELLDNGSSAADVRENLGALLIDQGDPGAAIEVLAAAADGHAEDPTAHYNLACGYIAQRRWNDAVAEFQKAMTLDPKDPHTRFNLGIALRRSGNSADAERELRDFLALARGRFAEQRRYVEGLLRAEYDHTGDPDA